MSYFERSPVYHACLQFVESIRCHGKKLDYDYEHEHEHELKAHEVK